jgi:hypothetical protein
MKKRAFLLMSIMSFLLVLAACPETRRRAVTTGSLFEEMIDMTALARYPDPGFRMVQFSSTDRRSRVPDGPDWFANSDGFGGEPIPNFEKILKAPDPSGVGEYLMADVPGPGAVVRLWTASISGKVRLTIDDGEEPIYEGDADPFFRRPYDVFPEMQAIEGERFRRTVCQRDASYAPFPFAKRFRLVWIGKVEEIHFYHIQVRLYARETAVVSFRPGDLKKFRDVIDRVTAVMADPDIHLPPQPQKPAKKFLASLPPGARQEMLALKGPGAVARLTLRLQAGDMDSALRQTVLNVVCDGQARGQIQSPVGDFFGAAPGINPFASLPFAVKDDGSMICRFVMPFQTSLSVLLENRGGQSVEAAGELQPTDFSWDENSLHFYARWRVAHNVIASDVDVQDLLFLQARGRGLYVGSTSILLNPASVPTSWGNWWGEGDEKVFVDDDKAPSIFGTGSEDYYNYSWSSPDIFSYPYCGQPRNDGPGNRGFVSNFRWHILDPIPFEKSLRFTMELNSHERTPGLSYARIGYYYARPGSIDDHPAIMPEDLRPLELPESWQPAARFGARNSIFYQAEEILPDRRATRLEAGRLWAGGRLLIWKPEKAGDRKALALPVDASGRKRLHVTAALTPRAGTISVRIDGRPVSLEGGAAAIDLHCPFGTRLRDFAFEPVELVKGVHTVDFEFKDAEQTKVRPEIGLDFIWIQKVD